MIRQFTSIASVVFALVATTAQAGDCGRARSSCCPTQCCQVCYQPGDCCAVKPCPQQTCTTVERTVMVPQTVTETRKVKCTEYRQETRERKVTVYEQVPVKRTVTREYTEWVQEPRTCEQKYTVCTPVWKDVTRKYTVNVPHVEQRQGVRNVVRCVPVKCKRIVCEDQGHWEERPVNPCATSCRNGCAPCPTRCNPCCPQPRCVQRVWVPNIVQREIEETVMRRQCAQEPCTYQVTVCKPETRTCTTKVCEYKQEIKTRQVNYTVCVPKKRTCSYEVTEYKCVPKETTQKYTVCVPHEVEKEVQVQVCKMVPQTVTEQVPVAAPCPTECSPCPTTCCP